MNKALRMSSTLRSMRQASIRLERAWPFIVEDCRAVLGSELHYQAMIYHCLRAHADVPVNQIGMNVKQWIPDVTTELFRSRDAKKHEDYRGGFEPIPDIVIFGPGVGGDWRRRNRQVTLREMLLAIEVKASERSGRRLMRSEVVSDIAKLAAHRDEVRRLGSDFRAALVVIDTAPNLEERMTSRALREARQAAADYSVELRYLSQNEMIVDVL